MKPNAYRQPRAIARNSFATHQRKLLVDISVLVEHDAKTGIQRVSRSILSELLKSGVAGYTVSAVYYRPGECYRYANEYLNTHFNGAFGPDVPVLFTKDDILVATDLTAHLFPELTVQLDYIRLSGAKVCFVVHDILPLRRPEWSDEGMQRVFPIWLSCIAQHADRLICVSASVAEDVKALDCGKQPLGETEPAADRQQLPSGSRPRCQRTVHWHAG